MSSNRAAESLPPVAIWPIVAVIVLAVVLRTCILMQYGPLLAEDHDNYRRIAQQLADGQGYVDPQTGHPTAYRPPLYPLLLSAVIRCGGSDAAIGIVQAILGVATVWLTILAGRRLGLGRGSILAGALVAVDPILLFQTSQVMTETTAAFLAVLCLWLCLLPPSSFKGLLIGVVFGAACLCRPTFWAFGIVAGVVWVIMHIRSIDWQESYIDGGIRPAVFALAGVIAVVGPWANRNSKMLRRPVVTTTHGGYTLLLSHNPDYTRAVVDQPWGTVWPSKSFDEWTDGMEAELAALQPPRDRAHLSPKVELTRDDWMNSRAWRYIHQDRKTAIKAGLTLLGRMWNIVPAATDGAARSSELRLAIGAFYIPVLAALIVGAFRVIRADWPTWWLPVVMIVSYSAVHALYWADMRMRAPLVPAIALLAAASWFDIERPNEKKDMD